jgi:hypothetical protein
MPFIRPVFCCAGCRCLWQARIAWHGMAFVKSGMRVAVYPRVSSVTLRRVCCPIFQSGRPGPPFRSSQPIFQRQIQVPIESLKNRLRNIKVRFITLWICVLLSRDFHLLVSSCSLHFPPALPRLPLHPGKPGSRRRPFARWGIGRGSTGIARSSVRRWRMEG